MAFSTYYKFEGEIKHISKNQLENELERTKEDIEEIWRRITILIAMSPTEITDSNGLKLSWPDYVAEETQQLREEIDDAYGKMHRLSDAVEAQQENPKNIHDDNDEWDEEHDKWADE